MARKSIGLSSQFNEDVIFLKDVKIDGNLSFGSVATFDVPVTFNENVFFKKRTVDENVVSVVLVLLVS